MVVKTAATKAGKKAVMSAAEMVAPKVAMKA